MSIKTMAFVIAIVLSGSAAFSENIVSGMDLDKYDWNYICGNIKPIPLKTPVLSCEISHPASKWHNYKLAKVMKAKYPELLSCKVLSEEFEYLTKPVNKPGEEWKLCYMLIQSALKDRSTQPESFYYDLESWKQHVFITQKR
jgi:hypothetical protein